MRKIKLFLTGATGNVGSAILSKIDFERFAVTAAVRDVEHAKKECPPAPVLFVHFDFEKEEGFDGIDDHDIVFLLRPPKIGDVKRDIEPFLNKVAQSNVSLLVFLSVQGAEKKSFIPHSKIENSIRERGIPHVFLRCSYFMDNLTTTLYRELALNQRIYLPSGGLTLNWIDVSDVAEVCTAVFSDHHRFKADVLTLTNTKNQGFAEVVDIINDACGTAFKYESPGVVRYVLYMKEQGHAIGYIGVMLLLHFLPRFEKPPVIYPDMARVLGREPCSLSQFAVKNKAKFKAPQKEF